MKYFINIKYNDSKMTMVIEMIILRLLQQQ
jgi:hypothetical protein